MTPISDTLEYARTKAYAKDFAEADRVLSVYNTHHSHVEGMRLHAQVLHWQLDDKRAASVYEQGLAAFPASQGLQLDYARLLLEQNALDKAQALLRANTRPDSLTVDAQNLLALISYKQLRLGAARKTLNGVLSQAPGNATATAMLLDIDNTTNPYLRAGTRYLSDDQPLRAWSFEAEATWFRSWLLAPTVQLQANRFSLPEGPYRSHWVQVGNKFSFLRAGLTLNATAGLFQFPQNNGSLRITGNLLLTKSLSRKLAFDFNAARQPYQAVLASVRQPVMEQLTSGALRYAKGDKWLGKAGLEQRRYGDDNPVYAAYAWLLAPVLTHKKLALKAGYAFSYASARYSTYTPLRTLADVAATGGPVPGAYAPYFTPRHQFVNSLLVSAKASVKKVDFSARGSYGVLGRADAPYLFLNRANNNELILDTGFSRQSYHPVELQAEAAWQAAPGLTLAATYSYARLIFYTRHQAELQLRYHLRRETNR